MKMNREKERFEMIFLSSYSLSSPGHSRVLIIITIPKAHHDLMRNDRIRKIK